MSKNRAVVENKKYSPSSYPVSFFLTKNIFGIGTHLILPIASALAGGVHTVMMKKSIVYFGNCNVIFGLY